MGLCLDILKRGQTHTDTYRHTYMALDTLHVRQKSKRLGEMVKYFFAKHTHTHTQCGAADLEF